MYLIHIPAEKAGFDHWLYFEKDPRPDGCAHAVVEDVEFSGLDSADFAGRGSASSQFPVLARLPESPNYRLFPSLLSVPFDYERLSGFAFEFPDWPAFMATPIAKDDQWRPLL